MSIGDPRSYTDDLSDSATTRDPTADAATLDRLRGWLIRGASGVGRATKALKACIFCRQTVGWLVTLSVAVYLAAVITGRLPAAQKLGVSDLAVVVIGGLVLGILWQPQLLDRVSHLKVGSVLEFQLEQLERHQQTQKQELDDLRFALTLLLTADELRHLRNLEKGVTTGYSGTPAVRYELRRLRAIGLIESKRYIHDLRDSDDFDLSDFVELTDRGRYYLHRIRQEGGPVRA
jgi:hypothetical protein